MGSEITFFAEIQGLIDGNGDLIRWCLQLPSYATSQYVVGLFDAPASGTSSKLSHLRDRSLSSGGFRLTLMRTLPRYNLKRALPRPISALTADDVDTTTFQHLLNNDQAGIVVGMPLFIGTESFVVSTAGAGTNLFSVATRGAGESFVQTHKRFAGIYDTPPAMAGRRVKIYRTLIDGSAADEVRIWSGVLVSEVSASAAMLAWSVDERFAEHALGALNRPAKITYSPEAMAWALGQPSGPMTLYPTSQNPPGAAEPDLPATYRPRFKTDGGYWWIPALGRVWWFDWNEEAGVYGRWVKRSDESPAWKADQAPEPAASSAGPESLAGYQVARADARAQRGPFGYWRDQSSTFIYSDHPVVIWLNILLSSSTANANNDLGTQHGYDLGPSLWPDYSIEHAAADIDWRRVNRALTDLIIVHARSLWLGGAKSTNLETLTRQMFAPLGYITGTTRAGLYTLFRLGRPDPGQGAPVLDESNMGDWQGWQQVTEARPINSLWVGMDTGPDGTPSEAGSTRIDLLSGANLYPDQVGVDERFPRSPYLSADFDESTEGYAHLAVTAAQFAYGLSWVRGVKIGPALLDLLEIGQECHVAHPLVTNPESGVDGDYQQLGLPAVATRIYSINPIRGTATVDLLLFGDRRLGSFAPTATVTYVDSSAGKIELEAEDDDVDSDGFEGSDFFVGQIVRFVDKTGAPRTEPHTILTISGIGTPNMTLDGDISSVVVGDLVVISLYDDVTQAERDAYAFGARGGQDGTPPSLGAGGDEPYVYGD